MPNHTILAPDGVHNMSFLPEPNRQLHLPVAQRLPQDVLQTLFLICQDVLEATPGYIHFRDSKTFVRIVIQVSSFWRATAFATPELWARLSFRWIQRNHVQGSPGPFLEWCLKLSRSYPLSIHFDSKLCNQFGTETLKALGCTAERWENISFDMGAEDVQDKVFRFVPIQTVFASLKCLCLASITHPLALYSTPSLTHLRVHDGFGNAPISLFSAPSLTTVATFNRSKRPQEVFVAFPWIQITHYELSHCFSTGDLRGFLDGMPCLTSLEIHLSIETELHEVIALPRLKSLTVHMDDGYRDIANNPMNYFVAPALKTFRLRGELHVDDDPIFVNFIRRSACSIETLLVSSNTTLGLWNIDEMKNLKHLEVRVLPGHEADIFRSLAQPTGIFPQTESITFRIVAPVTILHPFPTEDFKTMLQLFREGHQHLKMIKLMFMCRINPADAKPMLQFLLSDSVRRSGIEVILEDGSYGQ